MPEPVDTHDLIRSLQSLAESTESARSAIVRCIEELRSRGLRPVVGKLVQAAEDAGMPHSRACHYGEEYQAALNTIGSRLAMSEQLLVEALDRLGTAEHIATVVPSRCPRSSDLAGDAVLVLSYA